MSLSRRYHLQRRHFYNQTEVDEQDVTQFSPSEAPMLRLNSGETARLVREVLATLDASQPLRVIRLGFQECVQQLLPKGFVPSRQALDCHENLVNSRTSVLAALSWRSRCAAGALMS
jgi:hypothetical protein